MPGSLTADPRVGTELAGYRIEALLGRGGMSTVYLAEDLRLERKVALKLIAPELAEDVRFRERFLRESRITASLEHSNVIPVYEAGEVGGLLYIAMRYVEGADLRRLLEEERRLEPYRALGLLDQVASALDAAHARGLVHRDVKPGNILITTEAGAKSSEHVYLSDFGLTKHSADEGSLTEKGELLGTLDYIAPEQIEGGPVDARTDVYALGCVLYQGLTGEVPFKRDSKIGLLRAHLDEPPPAATSVLPDLPAGIDHVIAKALAKGRDDRYASCGDLLAAARDELVTAARLSQPAGPGEKAVTVPRGRRPVILLLAVAAAVVASAATVAVALVAARGDDESATKKTLLVETDSLQRIDPATNELVATIQIGEDVGGVAVGDGSVWVASHEGRAILEIDPKTDAIVRTVDVGRAGTPTGIDVGAGAVWTSYPATAGFTNGSLWKFNPRTGAFVAAAPDCNAGIAVGEGVVWGLDACNLEVLRIEPEFGDVVDEISVSGLTGPIAVDGQAVWVVGGFLASTLTRIDPATNEVVATLELPNLPSDLAVGEGAVWITTGADNSVSRIDPGTNRITDTIPVGQGPVSLGVGEGSVWVANLQDGTVSRVDAKTMELVATIEVGPNPLNVAVGVGGVWVTTRPD